MSRPPYSRLGSGQHSAGDVTSLQTLIAKTIAAATEVAEDLAEGGAKYAQHVTTIGDQVGRSLESNAIIKNYNLGEGGTLVEEKQGSSTYFGHVTGHVIASFAALAGSWHGSGGAQGGADRQGRRGGGVRGQCLQGQQSG